jgi:hypothetical protein
VHGCLLSGGQYTTLDDPGAVSTFAFGNQHHRWNRWYEEGPLKGPLG